MQYWVDQADTVKHRFNAEQLRNAPVFCVPGYAELPADHVVKQRVAELEKKLPHYQR
jgi:hypothetical protein